MSLLDDVRRLAADMPVRGGSLKRQPRCYYCLAAPPAHPHDPDCPWLSMPRIVAALEAAERAHGAWYAPYRFPPPELYVRMVALGKALRGEGVKA